MKQDSRKLHRCTELLSMNEELKQARKAFDVNEETLVNPEWKDDSESLRIEILWWWIKIENVGVGGLIEKYWYC